MTQEFVDLKNNIGKIKQKEPQKVAKLNQEIEAKEKEMIDVSVNLKREKFIQELTEMKKLGKGQVLEDKKIKEWKDEIA